MNAIERLRDHERFMWGDNLYKDKKASSRQFDDDLAAVDALYQAAKHIVQPFGDDEVHVEWHGSELLAAVRRVEGD